MHDRLEWLSSTVPDWSPWLLSLLLFLPFLGTLLLVPLLVIRLPADYFTRRRRQPLLWGARHPVPRFLVRLLKNLLGLIVILMGITMLVLPGQGLLSIVLGFLLLEFPGKFRAERWLISRPPVLRTVNWMRAKRGREPIRI